MTKDHDKAAIHFAGLKATGVVGGGYLDNRRK